MSQLSCFYYNIMQQSFYQLISWLQLTDDMFDDDEASMLLIQPLSDTFSPSPTDIKVCYNINIMVQ